MSISDFIRNLNTWGRERVPFLFVVDFEMEKPYACVLRDLPPEQILFDFQGFTNAGEAKTISPQTIVKYPGPEKTYQDQFDVVMAHLNRGDSFLTNLTVKTEIKTEDSLHNLFYSAHARYRLLYDGQFLVFSPETFVRIEDGMIYSNPMKGTIDASLPHAKQTILTDRKEFSEHVTIVDLIRNDISRVAEEVTVSRFRYVEELKTNEKTLLQVSSEITGKLTGEYWSRIGDILVSVLPAGSVSGAPKAKTLEIIRLAEKEKRGYYTGVAGYFDGTKLDSCVLIRFIERSGDRMFYRSGGGITTQSIARKEFQEIIDKVYVPST